jgi:P-type conjugative transfer protein TrbJ
MKPRRPLFTGTVLAVLLALAAPVSADLPVIDVSNLKQSILTAAHTLQEVNNQITQIQQFVQMLQNQARNLLSLPFSALQQITSATDEVNSLMRQAQALA